MFFAEESGWKPEEIIGKWPDFLQLFRKTQPVSEKQEKFLERFARIYGIDFVPVYSVIGSVASQEFIKVVGGNQEPGVGWFCYDSEEGNGRFERN